MKYKNRLYRFACSFAAVLLLSTSAQAQNWWFDNLPPTNWAATWATASKVPVAGFDPAPPTINDTTLRQIVRISEGGRRVRVWLTNEFGTAPLNVAEAHIAMRDSGSAIQAETDVRLTFGGDSSVTIAPGARVVSDAVDMLIPDHVDLTISIYLPDDVSGSGSPVTQHVRALQTNYLATGNQTADAELTAATTTTAWHYPGGGRCRQLLGDACYRDAG